MGRTSVGDRVVTVRHLLEIQARVARIAAMTGARRLRLGARRPGWPFLYESAVAVTRDVFERFAADSAATLRREYDLLATLNGWLVRGLPSRPFRAGEVRGRRFRVPGGAGRTLLYLHGGGYSLGSVNAVAGLVAQLGRAGAADVVSVDYRLAPEHPFPAALEDALTTYRTLLRRVDPRRLLLAGDSAGGGLVLATLLGARQQGLPMPAGAILISPWVDLCRDYAPGLVDRDDILPAVSVPEFRAAYVARGDCANPLISPLRADLRGLPPLLVHVGGAEMLRDQCEELADKAMSAGVDVSLFVAPDMVHAWHYFLAYVDRAREAIEDIGRFMRRHASHAEASWSNGHV